MWLAVPPLLRGIIEARQIELDKPVLRLRAGEDGTGNWSKLQIKPGGLAFVPQGVALNSARIRNGQVILEGGRNREIARLSDISGELTAVTLAGPYKFIGTLRQADKMQEIRVSTARAETDGSVRFRATARHQDGSVEHTIDGSFSDLMGKLAGTGRIVSRGRENAEKGTAGYEFAANLKTDASALSLSDITITFTNQGRHQSLKGSAVTSWTDGVITETRLNAPWLDLDAIAGTQPGESATQAITRLLTRGIEPLGAGVTGVEIKVDQANLAGASIADLKARMVRRNAITKIESLRAALPGVTALAIDGYMERRRSGVHFDGNVLLRSSSLGELASWAGLGRHDTRPKPASGTGAGSLSASFSASGPFRLRPGHFELSKAFLSLGDARAEGTIRYDWTGRPAITAEIWAGELDLANAGHGILSPALIAHTLGFDIPESISGTRIEPSTALRDHDLTLKLKASRITDGEHDYGDVDINFARIGQSLKLSTFEVTVEPGLQLSTTGELTDLGGSPSGTVTGTVTVPDGGAARRLAALMSLGAGRTVEADLLAARVPLRMAVDATFKASADPAAAQSRIVADGTIGSDRVRLEALTRGALTGWLEQWGRVTARFDGPDALETMRFIVTAPLGQTVKPQAKSAGAPAAGARSSVLLTATGTPSSGMKTFAKFDAGDLLDANFNGDVRLQPADPASGTAVLAAWSGEADVRRSTIRSLARLAWPALAPHVGNVPVAGRLKLARTGNGYTISPTALTVAGTPIEGELMLSSNGKSSSTAITGRLSLGNASVPDLASLVLATQHGGTDDTQDPLAADTDPSIWPSTPFRFQHLADVATDIAISIGRLRLASKTELANATWQLKTSGNGVAVRNFTARHGAGQLEAEGNFMRTPAGTRLVGRLAGKDLSLGDFAPTVAQNGRLAGKASFEFGFEGQALSAHGLASQLSGKGSVRLAKVFVPGLTVEALTNLSRTIIDGTAEIETLEQQVVALAREGLIEIGSPVLTATIGNGTLSLATIEVAAHEGHLRNQTVVDLATLKTDSAWQVTPAPQPRPDAPDDFVALPAVSVVYAGQVAELGDGEALINTDELQRELVVRKMEANVARLERLRREDEARAEAERERLRQIEEEQQRSLEAERERRLQLQNAPQPKAAVPADNAPDTSQAAAAPPPVSGPTPVAPSTATLAVQPPVPVSAAPTNPPAAASAARPTEATPTRARPRPQRRRRIRRRQRPRFNPFSSPD